jgi:acyl carrier protein
VAVAPDLDVRLLAAIADAMPMRRKKRLQINAETRLHAELGLDSLGLLALLFRLQETFAVELDDDLDMDVGALRTVGDLLRVVRTLLAPARGDEAEVDP